MEDATTRGMETIDGRKRMADEGQGQEEVTDEHKRSREDEKEEEWMLSHLTWFRSEWTDMWSDHFGDVEKTTAVPPMQFNKEPIPSHAKLFPALQIFSVRVTELKGKMCWPMDVFGLVAVRDSVDRNRNTIFERHRGNCQTLTAKDSCLVLTGLSRAVLLYDPVDFEIELRAKGATPSEDKVLSAAVFEYNCITQEDRAGSLRTRVERGLRCTLEFRYAHLHMALEAQIQVRVAEGLTEICGKFITRTASINESVMLLDSRDGMVSISDDGFINFSRNVVVVEGHDDHERLIVGVQARRSGEDGTSSVCKEVTFIPKRSGETHDTLDVGFCKMSVVVSWSLVF